MGVDVAKEAAQEADAAEAAQIRADALRAIDEAEREVRAQLAADMLGASAADVAHLKTTNLRETVAGESPYVPVVNDVTRSMAINQQATGFQPSQGVEYSGAVQQGPFPNMGAKTISAIRQLHATRGGGYGSMSDNPAKEVLQPGYRRRA